MIAVNRIFLTALSTSLRTQAYSGVKATSLSVWSEAAGTAKQALYRCESPFFHCVNSGEGAYAIFCADTRARPPSRTLVDPLEAFIVALPDSGLHRAADRAFEAAEHTRDLVAKVGRGAYVNQEDLRKQSVPDPGAWGIWRIVDGLRGYTTSGSK